MDQSHSEFRGKSGPIQRQDYLQELWQPYPDVEGWNSSEYIFGMLVEIDAKTVKMKTHVARDNQSFQHSGKLVNTPNGESQEAQKILQEGDRIAFHLPTKSLLLLAPKLGTFCRSERQKIMFLEWCHFLQNVRSFFVSRGFVETPTPLLVPSPGTEPFLQAFETEFKMGRHRKKLSLPTSPELHLKKLLGLGFHQIFEISRSFRNGEITPHHQPEFFMLEWYRAYSDLSHIKSDLIQLLEFLNRKKVNFAQLSVAELFKSKLGFNLTPQTSRAELIELALQQKLASEQRLAEFNWDEVFHLIFLEKIEHQWPTDHALFVEDYPPSQAAFARIGKSGWAQRFELYWKGMEIANAFHEVNDPRVQEERFAHDLKVKAANNLDSVSLDLEFSEMLKTAMPPSGGIALGLDRLFMALNDLHDINDFQLFAWSLNQD